MELKALDHLSAPKWPVALQQHPIFAAALRRLGLGHRMFGWENGVTRGEVLLMQQNFGPFVFELASRAHMTAEVARAVARSGPRRPLLAITPEVGFAAQGAVPVFSPAHVVEWDLSKSEKTRSEEMSGAWRTALKKAERAKLKISQTRPSLDDIGLLLAEDRANQKRQAYRALPPSLLLAIYAETPNALQLWQARLGSDIVAQALVILHGAAATYHIGWSSEAGRTAQAMNLVLWRASQALAKKGVERFDLGQIDTDRAPGLARFKTGTGAMVRPLGPTLFFGPLTGFLSTMATRFPGHTAPKRQRAL